MTINEVGIYPDVPEDQYHADPCADPSLSSGIIKLLVNASPLHAWTAHSRLNPGAVQEESETFDIGRAAHALLLEDERDALAVIDPRDHPSKTGSIPAGWTNKSIRTARDAARAAGKIPVLKEQHASLLRMVESARLAIAGTPEMSGWAQGDSELTLVWKEAGDLWCRARIDRRMEGMLFDYKSTVNASPDAWARNRLVEMGYDIQAAWYLRGWKTLTGEDADFVFGVQETAVPYEFSLVGVSHAMLELGRRKIEMGLDLWRRCLIRGQWPGYPRQICWPDPQAWHESRLEERVVYNELLGGQA